MRNRERQQWTEYVRRIKERKDKKSRKPRAKKKPEPSQAELDAVLDDLTGVAPVAGKALRPVRHLLMTGGAARKRPSLRRLGED